MVRRKSGEWTPPSKTVARLVDRITATLREYLDQGGTRTDLLHKAAKDVVDLRLQFERNDAPDWSGRSGEYQYAMSEILDRLNVKGKRRNSLAFSIRFHAGNMIRERADVDELEAAGLGTVSPKDRIQNRRDANAAAAGLAGLQAGDTVGLPKVLAWASTLLEYAENMDAGELGGKDRAAARALLGDLRKSLDALDSRL